MAGARRPPRSACLPLLAALLAATTAGAESGAPRRDLAARPLAGPKADVAGLLLAASDGGSLRAAALALGGCDGRVDFWMELEGASLLDEAALGPPPEFLRLELYAYAVTPSGELAGSLSRWVQVPLETLGGDLLASGVKLAGHLELPPGDYQLRLLAREPRSQRFALRLLGVTLGDAAMGSPLVSPPLVADADRNWIVVRDAEDLRPGVGRGLASQELPSALPVLVAGEESALRVRGCGLAGRSLAARLLNRERQPITELELRTVAPAEPTDDGAHAVRWRLPEVEPGTYLLELSTSGAPAAPPALLPIVVLAAALDEPPASWAAVRRLAEDPEEQRRVLEVAAETRGAKRVAAVAAAYRGVLERLSIGETEAAIERLGALDRETFDTARDRSRAQRWLLAGQERVVAALADQDPESLLPLLVMHLETHARYRRQGLADPLLLGAVRERIVLLARTYVTQSSSDLAPSLAATALAELGVALERAKDRLGARRVLEEAVAMDDQNAATLLALAHLYERTGLRQEAATTLRKLLARMPSSDEGRLRLALNLRHLGEVAEAARLLRQVIVHGTPGWLLTIAYEELGRLLLQQENFAEAARVLEEGISRLPDEQRLYVHLAYLLDRGGDRQLGFTVLDRAPAASGRPSPRLLYSRPPPTDGGEGYATLRRHGYARLPLLGQALAGLEQGG